MIKVIVGESVAVHSAMFGSRQFGSDVIIVENYGIVTRRSFFVYVAIGGSESLGLAVIAAGIPLHLSAEGHKEKVIQVGAAGAAEVGMAESEDSFIVIVIAAAWIVGIFTGVGTQLHQSERETCAGKIAA